MKKNVFLLIVIVLSACKNDDDFNHADISGEWKMVKYLAYTPELPIIEKGSVIWNIESGNITMTNNSEYEFVSREGTYSYQWVSSSKIRVNYPDYDSYFRVEVANQSLRLIETGGPGNIEIADGAVLEFEK